MEKGYLISIYILRIFCVILFVVLSIPIWNSFDNEEKRRLAEYYDDYYYVDYQVMKDTNGIDKVVVSNYSNTLEDYELVLKVKESNLNAIENIAINDKSVGVGEYEFYRNGSDIYLVLDTSSIVADTKEYNIKINCKENTNYNLAVVDYQKM